MDDGNKNRRMVLVDGRYVGFSDADPALNPGSIEIHEALEVVTTLVPMQTRQGMANLCMRVLHPLALTLGPKTIRVRYTQVFIVDSDLSTEEQMGIKKTYDEALENLKKQRLTRETGLVIQ